MSGVSLVATASSFPETVVDNGFFSTGSGAAGPRMFTGTELRHHVGPDDTATEMIVQATSNLAGATGIDPAADVDLVLTNTSISDAGFTGCGASVCGRLGISPEFVLDLHNTGCVSFISMLKLAEALIATSGARSALIANVANAGGRLFSHPRNRGLSQAPIPGDGCGVGLVVRGDVAPVLAIEVRTYGAWADDMVASGHDGSHYWEPSETPVRIDFAPEKIEAIVKRGTRIVPEAARAALDKAGLRSADVDLLVTNQPNPIFLDNWGATLGIPRSRHVDTFGEHGNLFGAAMPICIERAVLTDRVKAGDNVLLAGFSHAGDYAGAAVVRWGDPSQSLALLRQSIGRVV